MDLGIRGRQAIVCASSKGLGLACAQQLAREGVNVVMLARGAEALEAAAQAIRAETGVNVTTIATDITTPEGRAKVLALCPNPDILVTNAGGPKPGDFREWSRDDWVAAVDANMITPIELIRATVDGMIERKFGRIVNITSASVKHRSSHLVCPPVLVRVLLASFLALRVKSFRITSRLIIYCLVHLPRIALHKTQLRARRQAVRRLSKFKTHARRLYLRVGLEIQPSSVKRVRFCVAPVRAS